MYCKPVKFIAAVVVLLFTWTSGGVFSVAQAAQQEVLVHVTGDLGLLQFEGIDIIRVIE